MGKENHILIGWRKAKGLKQHEMAKKLNITQSFLSQLENGKDEPSFELAKKIAKMVEVEIGVIFPKYKL